MKKIIVPALIAFTCISFAACNNADKKDKQTATEKGKDDQLDMKKIVEDHPGLNAGTGTFSIEAPAGWTKKDTSMSGAKLTTITSPDDGPNDKFKENVNVTTENAKGHDLSSYVAANRESMSNQISDIEYVSEGETTIGDMPSKWLVYSFNYAGFNLKNTAYFFVKNDIGYVVTCTALKSTFDRFQPGFKACVNTFKVN